MIKKLNRKTKTILASFLGAIVAAVLVLFLANHFSKLNSKEREMLDDFTRTTLIYLDEFDVEEIESHPDEATRLAAFAVAYNYGENNSLETNAESLNAITKKALKKELNENDLMSASINSYLSNKGISYNSSSKSLIINQDMFDKRTIAKVPLYLYHEKQATARGGKIIVKYEKIKISNPYDILNYAATNQIDVPGLSDYLEGHASYANLKRAVKNEDMPNIGEHIKDLKITYRIENDSLYIDKIE